MLRVRFVRYLLIGCANTFVGLSVIYFSMYALRLGNAWANVVGYAVGVLFSFALNKGWTFGHVGPVIPAFVRFAAVLCLAYAVNLMTVLALADHLHVNRYLAQAAGVPPYTIVGYLGSRFFAFRSGNARIAAPTPR